MPRKARLDKATVVRAAADLINSDGLDTLSLSRLAERLDVQTPSLYNHIDGLPGLYRELALLNTRELGERLGNAAIGKSGAEAVRALAQAYRAFIKESPGVYMASLRVTPNGNSDTELAAAQERVVQIVVAVVESFGLRGKNALHAVRGLRSVVHGFATLEVAGGFGLPLDCDESFRRVVDTLIRGLAASGY